MTDEQLPAPLVPAEIDLRSYQFMSLDVVRLRDSRIALLEDAEAFRAAVFSWCAAWHQTPAGSLPDDDAELCRLLGYGRDLRRWRRLRAAGALHSWIKCSDGRLYHPVVAEKAIEAWGTKRRQKKQTAAASAARARRLAEEKARENNKTDERNVGDADDRNGARNGHDNGGRHDAATDNATESIGEDRIGEERIKKERKQDAASAASGDVKTPTETDLERDLYRRGKQVLGVNAGGMIKKLVMVSDGEIPKARAAIELASTKSDPREYIGAVIRGKSADEMAQRSYRDPRL